METLKVDVDAVDAKSHYQQRRSLQTEYGGDDSSRKKRNLAPVNPLMSAPLITPLCGMVLPTIVPVQAGDRNQRTKRRARTHQNCAQCQLQDWMITLRTVRPKKGACYNSNLRDSYPSCQVHGLLQRYVAVHPGMESMTKERKSSDEKQGGKQGSSWTKTSPARRLSVSSIFDLACPCFKKVPA